MATRFIKIRGRIVPISDKKEKGGYKDSKRYDKGKLPTIKQTSRGISGVVGAASGLLAKSFGISTGAAAGIGAVSYLLTRSTTTTKKAKGESNMQVARRVSFGNRAYNMELKKSRRKK